MNSLSFFFEFGTMFVAEQENAMVTTVTEARELVANAKDPVAKSLATEQLILVMSTPCTDEIAELSKVNGEEWL